MKTITIRTNKGFQTVNGYIVGDFGIHKVGKTWVVTDLATGCKANGTDFTTLKDAKAAGVEEAAKNIATVKSTKAETYKELVKAFKDNAKVNAKANKESEGKKMAKTSKAKASTKKSAPKKSAAKDTNADVIARLERENAELKARLKALEEPEIKGIDKFDVEGYLATRENDKRVTPELVKAFEETGDLNVEVRGKDGWLYVTGTTEDATKSRRDMFKAMGFRWSGTEKAWFLAPYPLASSKRWASKKARATA